MINVPMVDTSSPNIIVDAIGAHVVESPPRPKAIGRSPAIVVTDVNTIGRSRVTEPLITDSSVDTPSRRCPFMKLIKTMASLTQIPINAPIASITIIDRGVPEMNRYSIQPTAAKSIVDDIKRG